MSQSLSNRIGERAAAYCLATIVAILVLTSPAVANCPEPLDECNPDGTFCNFQGYNAIALGNARMQIFGGELFVENIGTSLQDGVQFTHLPGQAPPPPTGHEEWVELGDLEIAPISAIALSPGSTMEFNGVGTIDGIINEEVVTTMVKTGAASPDLISIASNFSDVDAITNLHYEVFNSGGGLVGSDDTASSIGTMTALDFPISHSFSEIVWPADTSIRLPNGTLVVGNRVEIHPEPSVPNRIADVGGATRVRAKNGGLILGGQDDLTFFRVRNLFLGQGPSGGQCVPTLSEWGLIGLLLLMAGSGYLLISRRRPALPH